MEKTGIEWTDATVNFWTGCEKVSQECKYCYMYRDMARWNKSGRDVNQVNEKTIYRTLSKIAPGSKIFTCSWSDFFLEEADKWREWAWDIIRKHPQFKWQILTKRPERLLEHLPLDWNDGWDHVWLGVSVGSQEHIHRAVQLLRVPSKTFFLSIEPMLGPVDLNSYGLIKNNWRNIPGHQKYIDWVIVGGESGFGSIPEDPAVKYRYRECNIDWIQSVVDQCIVENTPVFVKQLGTHLKRELNLQAKAGGYINEWPDQIKIRQFPEHLKHLP